MIASIPHDEWLIEAHDVLRPSSGIGLAEWSIRHVFNEDQRAFDHMAFPHMVAVGGPMDAYDAHWIREIVMQWGSRLGKTFGAFCAMCHVSEQSPCQSMAAGPQMGLAVANANRIRKMLRQIPSLGKQLPAKTKQERLEFGANTIHTAWARSPATLSDRNIQFGAANEFDLWEHLDTKDAPDPEKMFEDRFKDNWETRKLFFESIPMIHGRSRVERRRLTGSDCRLWVECQHCGTFQTLETEHCSEVGYTCPHCRCINEEIHRLNMLRTCVWVPAGCGVDSEKARSAARHRLNTLNELAVLPEDDPACDQMRESIRWQGWGSCDYLTGTPNTDNEVASYQLSSLYALKLSWKAYAQKNDGSQNFVNQWEGKTFEIEEDENADVVQMARDALRGLIVAKDTTLPDWSTIITLAGDRQMYDFPCLVVAWSEDLKRCRIIDAVREPTIDQLRELCSTKYSDRAIDIAVCDSGGFDTDTVYQWAADVRRKYSIRAYPVKGGSGAIDLDYKLNPIKDEAGGSRRWRRLKLCQVNTHSTQQWANAALKRIEFASGLTYSIPERFHKQTFDPSKLSRGPESIMVECLNDQQRVSKRTGSHVWDRIDFGIPNDLRDCLRYAYCAAQIERKRRMKSPQSVQRSVVPQQEKPFAMVGPSNLEAIVKALNNAGK